MKKIIFILTAVLILVGGGCQYISQKEADQTDQYEPIGLANPASVYCQDQGGKLEIKENSRGGQYGVCVFPDGSSCEEWAFYNGNCQPGDFPQGDPIDSFEECAELYQVMESYPRQCRSHFGTLFVEEIDQENIEEPLPDDALNEAQSKEMAENWIKNKAQTYVYDGYDLEFEKVDYLDCAGCYRLTYNFISRHGGYGDRSDQMVIQVITPHTIEITIKNGQITGAITDSRFDEIKQQVVEE